MVVGKSKAGKTHLCAQAPRPIFLCTENGVELETGITPIPIASWSDFKSAVMQLCTPDGRSKFDTVVIDTYTNLILLLDKFVGQKLTTEKNSLDFGTDAEYGKGSKSLRNELGIQLQKLQNQGYLIMNIVHAEDKVDFNTGKAYIGTSLSPAVYGVAEKFVDEIIYLDRAVNRDGSVEYKTFFNPKCGFPAGGRIDVQVDSVPTSFENVKKALEDGIAKSGKNLTEVTTPAFTLETDNFDFDAMMAEFEELSAKLVEADSIANVPKIRKAVEKILGPGKKVSQLVSTQGELLNEVLVEMKKEFNV